MNDSQKLYDDLLQMAEEIAEEGGQNINYCTSMDFSLFPWVVALAFTEDELSSNDIEFNDDTLGDLRFLAQNGNKFPKELENGTLDEFRTYLKEHRQEIFDEIRQDCQDDYEEYVGHKFTWS